LAALGAIEILSAGKERMLIQIPPQYWHPPPKASTPDLSPTTVPELVHRLCGHRASPEILTAMRTAGDNDEERVLQCLQAFLHEGKRWATPELLTVAVQTSLRAGKGPANPPATALRF